MLNRMIRVLTLAAVGIAVILGVGFSRPSGHVRAFAVYCAAAIGLIAALKLLSPRNRPPRGNNPPSPPPKGPSSKGTSFDEEDSDKVLDRILNRMEARGGREKRK